MNNRNVRYFFSLLCSSSQRKYVLRWIWSLRKDYLLKAAVPWITFSAADFVGAWIKNNSGPRVFEYGSGGSTLYWMKLCSRLVSVEHDPDWFRVIRGYIGNSSIVDYRLVSAEEDCSVMGAADDPLSYKSDDSRYLNLSFKEYASSVDVFPDLYFDIVLVDGRARPSCVKHAARKVRRGGLLILDNAERDYYTFKTKDILEPFCLHEFSGVGPCLSWSLKTNVYVKV